jgi:hypothetical protein
MSCDECYINAYYTDASDACNDDDKRACSMSDMNQNKEPESNTICPYYTAETMCDCPYSRGDPPSFTCPPAERIKEDIIDAAIEADQFRRHNDDN